MTRIPLALAVLLGLACFARAAEEDTSKPADGPPKVGAAAPDFELKGSDGKMYKLSDFKGKQGVIVAWFPKAFTGG